MHATQYKRMMIASDPELWQAWFDGCALPNPGRIGIGILILPPSGQPLGYSIASGLHGCNSQAELHALITALELASHQGASRLLLRGDSDVAIRYVNGTSGTQLDSLTPLIEQAQSRLARFEYVELQWVPRHRNTEADRLSRQALGLPEKPANRIRMKKRR